MMRRTEVNLHWRARYELERVRNTMWGRAKLEKKFGYKRMFFQLRTATKYRVTSQKFYNNSIVRRNVDSAAQEHGAAWNSIRNDFARQNVVIGAKSQQRLAHYEPLAFRSLMELAGSNIAPPAPPAYTSIPAEAYELPNKDDPNAPHPATMRELRDSVERIMGKDSEALKRNGPSTAEGWMESWKEFEAPATKKAGAA